MLCPCSSSSRDEDVTSFTITPKENSQAFDNEMQDLLSRPNLADNFILNRIADVR